MDRYRTGVSVRKPLVVREVLAMKLWLLRPVEDDPLWEPWYDKTFGFVIRAETESEARELAQRDAGDEIGFVSFSSEKMNGDPAWLSAEHSTCTELTANGVSSVMIQDFRSA